MLKITDSSRQSLNYLLKWLLLSLIAGLAGSLIVQSFSFLLFMLNRAIFMTPIPVPIFALIGALLVAGIIYRIEPRVPGEGIPAYISGIRYRGGFLPLSVTIAQYPAALITLGTFGNGGILGPVGRITAGVLSFMATRLQRIGFSNDDVRTAAMCGMAATTGALFNAPIGGGFLAVEITRRQSMGYRHLFPSILSSSIAVLVTKAFGFSPFYMIRGIRGYFDIRMIGWILLTGIVSGVAGGLYTRLYDYTTKVFRREGSNKLLKALTGTTIAATVAWAVNTELMGTSNLFLTNLSIGNLAALYGRISPSLPLVLMLVIMLLCKAFCNIVTVGSGMSAGFTMPVVIVGMLIGASFSSVLGIKAGTPDYYALLSAGFSGMIASSMNIPIAAAVMGVEIFGLHYSVPVTLSAIIGFQINRHQTIYDYALTEREMETILMREKKTS